MKNKLTVQQIALIGLFGALGAVLMLFRFPIPFMPPYMAFDFSGLVELIGGFVMGPVQAFLIVLIKVLVQVALQGTKSAMTGELQNIMLSSAFVLPAVIIYHHHKTRKNAVIGMTVGTVICSLVAVFTNLYIIIPFYVNLMGMSWESIIAMCTRVNPLMKDVTTMAIFGIIPFNLIKNGIVSVVTYFIYKRVSRPMKEFIQRER
ncbi:MAG: ECF transporter S component [Clostridiales bacterium]|nr:ECF transporter S component [Clostridiales bacterium]